MSDLKLITKIDEIERNRKADYSIWGYLYQFDITLLDCISDSKIPDYFGDILSEGTNVSYQIETVEDYIKHYSVDEKLNIRLAQVKYYSQTSAPNELSVAIDLYYASLLLEKLSISDINVKSRLIYNSRVEISSKISSGELLDEIQDIIGSYDKSKIEQRKTDYLAHLDELKTHSKRLKDTFQVFHDKSSFEKFYSNYDNVYELSSRELKSKIGVQLESKYNSILTEFPKELRQKVLYAISLELLISKWSNKSTKLDIVTFSITDLDNYIRQIAVSKTKLLNAFYKSSIIIVVEEILRMHKSELNFDIHLDETSTKEVIDIYSGTVSDYVIKIISKFLTSKEERYSLLSTITLNSLKSKSDYMDLDDIEELIEFSRQHERLKSFVLRLMKFLFVLKTKDDLDLNNMNDILVSENDYISFRHPNENRSCVLFPNYDIEQSSFEVLFELLNRYKVKENRPDIWYFHNLDRHRNKLGKEFSYNIDCTKPGELLTQPTYPVKERFFVECMSCLETVSPYECSDVACIFNKGCEKK